jgi:hypothetical protein
VKFRQGSFTTIPTGYPEAGIDGGAIIKQRILKRYSFKRASVFKNFERASGCYLKNTRVLTLSNEFLKAPL